MWAYTSTIVLKNTVCWCFIIRPEGLDKSSQAL